MLPDFFLTYTDFFQPLNLFKYITFRSIGALLTALLISFIFGPKIIDLLKRMQKKGQPIRSDGPKSHILFIIGIRAKWFSFVFFPNSSISPIIKSVLKELNLFLVL